MLLPAVLYLVQNTAQYVAATHLDAAVLVVLYQLKILTTSLCSMALLGRRYSQRQWAAIALCAFGAALVQHSVSVAATDVARQGEGQDVAVGIGAVVAVVTTSGLATAYTERVFFTCVDASGPRGGGLLPLTSAPT